MNKLHAAVLGTSISAVSSASVKSAFALRISSTICKNVYCCAFDVCAAPSVSCHKRTQIQMSKQCAVCMLPHKTDDHSSNETVVEVFGQVCHTNHCIFEVWQLLHGCNAMIAFNHLSHTQINQVCACVMCCMCKQTRPSHAAIWSFNCSNDSCLMTCTSALESQCAVTSFCSTNNG